MNKHMILLGTGVQGDLSHSSEVILMLQTHLNCSSIQLIPWGTGDHLVEAPQPRVTGYNKPLSSVITFGVASYTESITEKINSALK